MEPIEAPVMRQQVRGAPRVISGLVLGLGGDLVSPADPRRVPRDGSPVITLPVRCCYTPNTLQHPGDPQDRILIRGPQLNSSNVDKSTI